MHQLHAVHVAQGHGNLQQGREDGNHVEDGGLVGTRKLPEAALVDDLVQRLHVSQVRIPRALVVWSQSITVDVQLVSARALQVCTATCPARQGGPTQIASDLRLLKESLKLA